MSSNKLFIISAIILILASAGCSRLFAPTYPKDKLQESIQNICKKEYNINEKIDVKISGKTLGARIHLEELLDINLTLQKDALEKLQDLLKTVRRVAFSTDAELDFFVISGYEKKLGIEVSFYSYLDDMRRISADWISADDYFQRLVKDMRLDTLRWGNIRIDKLIDDIETGNIAKVMAKDLKLSELNPDFLKILLDLSKKNYIRWSLTKINSIPISSEERLYYLEAKEYYTLNADVSEPPQYPSGTIHKFYILIAIEDLNAVISSIYTTNNLPEKYAQLGDSAKWNANEYFVEDYAFHKFLSNQIIQRIQSQLSDEKKEDEIKDDEKNEIEKNDYSLKGDFIIKDKLDSQVGLTDPSNNILKIIISPKGGKKLELPQNIKDIILKTVKDVCTKYKFYDMGEIQMEDNKGNSLLVIDKPTLFKVVK